MGTHKTKPSNKGINRKDVIKFINKELIHKFDTMKIKSKVAQS